jgi:hypothetical protein
MVVSLDGALGQARCCNGHTERGTHPSVDRDDSNNTQTTQTTVASPPGRIHREHDIYLPLIAALCRNRFIHAGWN